MPRMPSLCSLRAVLHAHPALDDERGDLRLRALLGRRGAREDGEHVGEAAVGDPDLRAVEHVALAVGEGSARVWMAAASVPARRLGEREGGDQLAGGELGQVLALLLFGAEEQDALQADRLVRAERHRERRVEPADLLHRRARRRSPRGRCRRTPAG